MSLSQYGPPLRAINYRLSSTPIKNLPSAAPQIAASLWNVKDLLSALPETLKPHPELSALVHRFKTTLSSLLQDRTIEGRWAALVLAKATIEAGGLEILSKSGIWVKNLLTILKRPDPPTTRTLTVICLTRIFTLTWDHSQLVREITTPALPTFIGTCVGNVEHSRCSPGELQTVLEAFATLIPRHPTIFRTHEAHIRKVLSRILSKPSSNDAPGQHYLQDQMAAAQRLLVLLHHCAPKQGGVEKWEQTIRSAVATSHDTCDVLFRSVVERTPPMKAADGKTIAVNTESLSLAPWDGVYAGSDRLMTILGIIKAHVSTPTATPINIPIGLIFGLIRRILAIVTPLSDGSVSLKANPEIPRDEREALFSNLPRLHVATLRLVDCLVDRFAGTIASTIHGLTELVGQFFADEHSDCSVRQATYRTVGHILDVAGPSLSKEHVSDIVPIIRACCDDLLADAEDISSAELLTKSFSRIEQSEVPRQLRVQMERAAILANQREALVACVLNPARKDNQATLQPSLVPMLARLYPTSPETEALLRPRMPVVITGTDGMDTWDAEHRLDAELGPFSAGLNGLENNALNDDKELLNGTSQITHGDGNLYTSSPKNAFVEAAIDLTTTATSLPQATAQTTSKRGATDSLQEDTVIKRSKVTPTSTETPPTTPQASVRVNPIQQSTATPSQAASETTRTTPPHHHLAQVPPSVTGGESDDSDFEMPEINPDPDTDPEDEEDEVAD